MLMWLLFQVRAFAILPLERALEWNVTPVSGQQVWLVGERLDLSPQTHPQLYEEGADIEELVIEARHVSIRGRIQIPGGRVSVNTDVLSFPDATGAIFVGVSRKASVEQDKRIDNSANGLHSVELFSLLVEDYAPGTTRCYLGPITPGVSRRGGQSGLQDLGTETFYGAPPRRPRCGVFVGEAIWNETQKNPGWLSSWDSASGRNVPRSLEFSKVRRPGRPAKVVWEPLLNHLQELKRYDSKSATEWLHRLLSRSLNDVQHEDEREFVDDCISLLVR